MRYLMSAATLLLLAGCGTTPVPVITPDRAPVNAAPAQRGALIGLDASGLAARLGSPRLQVREGDGIKLQYGASGCVLDAYLYPGSGGAPRVTHIDTRTRDGRAIDQTSCLRMIEMR